MRLRHKPTGELLTGSQFNVHALFEVVAASNDDIDTYPGRDLDVFVEAKQEWKDLSQALKDKDVIPSIYNTWFGEPKTDADRERGYFLG